MSDWQDIALVPPLGLRPIKVDLCVLDCSDDEYRVCNAWKADDRWWVEGFFGRKSAFPWTHRATHFMLLPKLPGDY